MQFKHPELLYALFLLLIPIIVHLFQLRKFQKVAFTNVAFLKEAIIQTRKSSQIKKWLTLIIRLCLLATIILAFAQPFTSKTNAFKTKNETVIYLDNSFSMQAKGNQGELLKRAIQDIINNVPNEMDITLVTNDHVYKNTSINTLKNDLLQLEYSSNSLTTQAALLKSYGLFSKKQDHFRNLIFISDFQNDNSVLNFEKDSLTNFHLVKLLPINTNNVSIDSVSISEKTATNLELKVILKNNGEFIDNLPISLFNDNNLIAKTSVSIEKEASTFFSLPTNKIINGKLVINDAHLQFDNTFFFNINNTSKINVLTINNATDAFLKRIYTQDEFNYESYALNQLNYNILESQNLIILNELQSIPNALITALKQFTDQDGTLIIIPSKDITKSSYNILLSNYQSTFNTLVESEKRITTINYSHPLYNNGVFEKRVSNFQYPKVNTYYDITSNQSASVLKYEDNKPFLFKRQNAFVFTSSLSDNNSNFKNSPLIVPTLYNIGVNSFKIPKLYYTIGDNNTYSVKTQLQQDEVLSITNNTINIIPEQRYFNNKVVIKTSETPSVSNIYSLKNKDNIIENVSYNYNRDDSILIYKDLSNLNNTTVSNSINDVFDSIKSDTKVNALWKWFVIFALVLLIIEMLILKYFK